MITDLNIPRAVQLVLDDVGWREGWSLDAEGGPWRAGVDRLMEPGDYAAIANIGAELNMRPQAVMVLCEWDRENLCARCPSCTQSGANWDNRGTIGPWADEAADIFRTRAAHLELAMHGVGHEYWLNGRRVRAEWYGAQEGLRWPWEDLLEHLHVFREILDQHGLGPADGHSLPLSGVPCAFNYYLDDADPHSTGALFREAQVRYCSTPFGGGFHAHSPLIAVDGALDHGLLVIDRMGNGVPYNVFDTVPVELTRNSICGIHWPNILSPDPDENAAAVSRWVEFLRAVGTQSDMMLAASSAECFSQWVWHTFARVDQSDGEVVLDTSGVPSELLHIACDGPLWLKLRLKPGEHVSRVITDGPVPAQYGATGHHALLGLCGVTPGTHRLRIETGPQPLSPVVVRDGTCGVLGLTMHRDCMLVNMRVYGAQPVRIRLASEPVAVETDNPGVRAEATDWQPEAGLLTIRLDAHDIQGEIVALRLRNWTRVEEAGPGYLMGPL
ncbi:MAG: hypothetical protein HPY44_09485 [Armatimonadetes bacterium]|nr:hypothetical protein [Armatimonadota bacterium]